jgi:putative glycerol-1-phosphate prenyltransferase
MSHTLPIPRDKVDIAKYHALTAQYLGMKFVYMDAGSGAKESVPLSMIKATSEYIDIPIIVGGGIREPAEAKAKVDAGAKAIVIGSIIEETPTVAKEFASAIHSY